MIYVLIFYFIRSLAILKKWDYNRIWKNSNIS